MTVFTTVEETMSRWFEVPTRLADKLANGTRVLVISGTPWNARCQIRPYTNEHNTVGLMPSGEIKEIEAEYRNAKLMRLSIKVIFYGQGGATWADDTEE